MLTDELIDLLVRRADDLRGAGVLELQVGEVRVCLAPAEPIVDSTVDEVAPSSESSDPLDDPATYGLPLDAPVPGFAALRERRERERSLR